MIAKELAMSRHEAQKKSYLKRVRQQLKKNRFCTDDQDAILHGLSEHIDEEIWLLQKDNKRIDEQVMRDLLSNLELPKAVDGSDFLLTEDAPGDTPGTKAGCFASFFLSLTALPVTFIAGYFDHELAFDLLFIFTVTAVTLGLFNVRTQLGRQALLASTPAVVLLLFFAVS